MAEKPLKAAKQLPSWSSSANTGVCFLSSESEPPTPTSAPPTPITTATPTPPSKFKPSLPPLDVTTQPRHAVDLKPGLVPPSSGRGTSEADAVLSPAGPPPPPPPPLPPPPPPPPPPPELQQTLGSHALGGTSRIADLPSRDAQIRVPTKRPSHYLASQEASPSKPSAMARPSFTGHFD